MEKKIKTTTETLKKEAEARLKKENSALLHKMTQEENGIKSKLMSQIKDTETKLKSKLTEEQQSLEKVKSQNHGLEN